MASWKKVIVSGSQAELAGITGSLLTDDRLLGARDGGAIYSTGVEINGDGHLVGTFSGSASGSFEGDGSGLTGVVAQIENNLVDGAGIQDFTFDGSSEVTVSVDSGSLAGNGLTAKTDGTGFEADLSGSTLALSSDGIGVASGGITNTEMAANSVDSDQYVDGSIEFVHLDGAAVVTGAEGITAANTGSDDNLPTTKAVKDYVDNQLGASDLDIVGDTGTDAIDLDDDTLTFTGGNGIDTVVSAGQVSINGVAGLVSGSGQVVEHLPAGTVSGSAQIRSEISVTDTTGASGIDLTYVENTGVLSGVLANSTIGFAADSGTTQDVNLGADIDIAGGNNITTTVTAGQVSVALDAQIDNIGATGSFTGSFTGDGSGLTGLATTLSIGVKDTPSDTADNVSVDLLSDTLEIVGTANEVDASATGDVITLSLPQDVTIARDLTVTRDLTVLGDTTTLSTTNLLVEDAFILVASGSTGAVDGGIIVDGGDNNGEGFVYDTDAQSDGRWGFLTGMADGASSADLTGATGMFAAAVIDMNESHVDDANAQKAGNIKIATNQDIYIYS